ncbi:MAG: glycosyltransferase [Syntrophomonadales bacterium]
MLALRYQYSADFLLLAITAPGRGLTSGKLFEYLAAKRPIFALTEGTVAEDIINRTGTGICLSPNDIEGITRQLKNIINMYPNVDFYKPIPEQIAKYDRKLLTKQLADVFDRILDRK